MGEIELKKCCAECGFPLDIKRNPILIKNDIFSIAMVKVNTCGECGHQKDGWTIPVVYDRIRYFLSRERRTRRMIIKFFEDYIKLNGVERKRICCYVEKEGHKHCYSWNVVAIEVMGESSLSREMLEDLYGESINSV